MSERNTISGATWTQIGTGPATVQLISVGTPVMVACQTGAPSGTPDGMILVNQGDNHTFQLAQAIWAQVIVTGTSATLATQPE